MDQAKWYYICFDPCCINIKAPFYRLMVIYQLKNELEVKRMSTRHYRLQIFCGKKKLNKVIEEAHLLGLEDELLIFRKENLNG